MIVQKQKRGITLILAGLCLLVLSFPFVSIDSGDGVMDSLRDGELVFKEGYSSPAPAAPPATTAVNKLPTLPEGYVWEEVKTAATARPNEIRIALPYKYFFAFNVIFIFIGIWLVVIHRVENASSKQ